MKTIENKSLEWILQLVGNVHKNTLYLGVTGHSRFAILAPIARLVEAPKWHIGVHIVVGVHVDVARIQAGGKRVGALEVPGKLNFFYKIMMI